MSQLLRAKDYQSTPVVQDLKSLPGGGLVMGDWIQALIARGFGWHADVGAFSTPIVGGGNGTILDLDQPEMGISAPSGYTIIPIRIHVQCQTGLSAADSDENEILIAVDRAAKWVGDGTITTETPTNMRSDITSACPLSVFSAATADITDPVLGVELARAVKVTDYAGTPASALLNDLACLYEPLRPPFIVGPAAIYVYYGGTVAVSGFVNADFLAIPSTLLTSLV